MRIGYISTKYQYLIRYLTRVKYPRIIDRLDGRV
uniref:Uncharacterized protein n=1 Tax=Zea mays TaxID=4577 RepID=B7ZZC4_MAIZE|nr:unknown [Zea mays]